MTSIRELINFPNIALIIFSAIVAMFIYHFVSIPFEDE